MVSAWLLSLAACAKALVPSGRGRRVSSGTGISCLSTSAGLLTCQGGAKWYAVLVRPKDVRLIPLRRRRPAGTGPVASMPPWPCPGGHRCRVRYSRLRGAEASRCAASGRCCCPAGTTRSGMRGRWSGLAVRLPRVTARVFSRRLR